MSDYNYDNYHGQECYERMRKQALGGTKVSDICADCEVKKKEISDLKALVRAAYPYIMHQSTCAFRRNEFYGCDCGGTEIIRRAEEALE